jgi:hypothetical protein
MVNFLLWFQMHMDIVRILTLAHLKASYQTLKLKQKFFLIIFLLSLILNLVPQKTYAVTIRIPPIRKVPPLVFDLNDKSYQDLLDSISLSLTDKFRREKVRQQLVKRGVLASKVEKYLESQGSPLAKYTTVLISVKNWKQIVALANAESSLCRNYPVNYANCWGVGGSSLWDFGNNLGDGILAMDRFLNQYPLHSPVKYSQMSFQRMNGLYKQPAAQHWVYNAQSVYDDLAAIEKSI